MKQLFSYVFFFLLAFDIVNAQVVFQKTFGGDAADAGFSVQQTSDNGYIITGYTAGNTYLVRTDSTGTVIWAKTYGGAYALCVDITNDNGYIIAGRGGHNLIKTNGMGDTLWSKGIYYPGGTTWGKWVQQTTDGGYISVGQHYFINSGIYMYAVKTDSLGNTIWVKTSFNFPGSQSIYFDIRVHQTQDLGYIISGVAGQLLLLKIDSTGNGLWLKYYSGNSGNKSSSMRITNDKGYILVCSSDTLGAGGSDVYIIRTDSAGNVMWAKTYGGTGDDYGESVQQTSDGGYIIEGYTNSFGFGGSDVYLIKIDSAGNVEWSNTYGGSGNDYGYSVQQTTDSGYVIVGKTNSFGAGNYDAYLIKTDASGNIGGCNITVVNTIVTNVSPTVTIDSDTMVFIGVVSSNIHPVVNNITPSSCNACNPIVLTTDSINDVQCNGDTTGAAYISVTGGIPPYTYSWSNGDTTEDVTGIAAGSYTVTVSDAGSCITEDTSVTINEPVVLGVNILSNDISCTGNSDGTATATPSGGALPYSYFWSDSSTSDSIGGLMAGVYMVTVTDSNGCIAIDSVTISEPPALTINVSTAVCDGDSVQLPGGAYADASGIYYDTLFSVNGCDSVIITTLTANPTYTINTPDDTICNGDSISIYGTFRSVSGTYYDSLSTINGCDSISVTTLTVNQLPTVNLGTDTMICNGCSITLDADSGFTSYSWSTGDTTQMISVDSADTYTVQVTDANGCADRDTIVIDIASNINQYSLIKNQLKIYPNPNTGQFTLKINLQKSTRLSINVYQIYGQLIYTNEITNITGNYIQQLDLSKHAKGIYYVQVVTDSGVITKKVIYQ